MIFVIYSIIFNLYKLFPYFFDSRTYKDFYILFNIWYPLIFIIHLYIYTYTCAVQSTFISHNGSRYGQLTRTRMHTHSYSWFANSAITLGERENRTVVHYVYVTRSSCTYCIACLHGHKASTYNDILQKYSLRFSCYLHNDRLLRVLIFHYMFCIQFLYFFAIVRNLRRNGKSLRLFFLHNIKYKIVI